MVTSLFRHRTTAAWALLVVATLVSWYLGSDHGGGSHVLVSAVVLLVAFVKVQIIGSYFMELRDAPMVLRRLFEAYCLGICAVLVLLLLVHG